MNKGIASTSAATDAIPRPAAEALAKPCLACHAGVERTAIPDLAGRSVEHFVTRMRDFRDHRVQSVMHRIARGYRDEDYGELARYFRNRKRNP